MWELDAENLFAMNDVGIVPWIPLARTTASPTELITRCRDEIIANAPPTVRDNMLAATLVMARMNYNDPDVLKILGGSNMTIQSPAFDEVRGIYGLYLMRGVIAKNLRTRFHDCPQDIIDRLEDIPGRDTLDSLQTLAITAASLDEFRAAILLSE